MMRPDQIGELIDRHAAALVLYARQRCASAEDVVQDAFVKLAQQRKPPANVVGWLYRVVRNGAISAARSAKRRRKHEANAAAQQASWFMPGEDYSALDPDEVSAALGELPLESREIIVAHIWGELTFEQIGELVDSSASTAYRRYAEGLDILRRKMGVSCQSQTN